MRPTLDLFMKRLKKFIEYVDCEGLDINNCCPGSKNFSSCETPDDGIEIDYGYIKDWCFFCRFVMETEDRKCPCHYYKNAYNVAKVIIKEYDTKIRKEDNDKI